MPALDEIADADVAGDLALLMETTREAGQIALRFFGKSPEVWMKGGTSPVSEADYAVDAFLRDALRSARPDYGWLSEETIDTAERLSAARVFIVDPIDGTRGFLQGVDRWCVSVGIVENGRPIAGVLECPARKETFWALAGMGSARNGKALRIRPSSPRPRIGGPRSMIGQLPGTILDAAVKIPYVPSLAYRLAMIAAGELDATFVKPNSHDWDLAAADLIVSEAGGTILDAEGRRPVYGGETTRHGALAAGSGKLLSVLVDVMARRSG